MVPYRGRLALRIARFVLALACLAWYARSAEERFTSILAVLAAYAAYAIGALFEAKFDSAIRAGIALIADALYFGFWNWLIAAGWLGWPAAGWPAALLCGYLLASAAVLHDLKRVLAAGGAAV